MGAGDGPITYTLLSLSTQAPMLSDILKKRAIRAVRWVNERSIQHWSRQTYRRQGPRQAVEPQIRSARSVTGDPNLPEGLFLPDAVPRSAELNPLYVLPYYQLTGALFKLYVHFPLSPEPRYEGDRCFPRSTEGWANLLDEEEFCALRTQGPNPFLLTRTADGYGVDYARYLEGLAPPVQCEFSITNGRLALEAIRWDGDRIRPDSPRWTQAKLLANALDARIAIFVQHLMQSHLRVGQAFALAAWKLPVGHSLRPMMDLHSYGSLQVNNFAWNFLLSPASYFILSGVITRAQGLRLLQNALKVEPLPRGLDPRTDIRQRGLETIEGHAYAEDALEVAGPLEDHVRAVVDARYASNNAVCSDPGLQRWAQCMQSLLPLPPLETRQELCRWLFILLYNNVFHEVSGDFAIYACPSDALQQKIVRWDTLLTETPPAARDVFLFDQGAWSGMFNTAGNNLLQTPVDAVLQDPLSIQELATFRAALTKVDGRLRLRNSGRKIRLDRMLPSQWELSISF